MAKVSYESLYDLHFCGEPVLSPMGHEFLYVHTVMDKKANGYRSVIRRFDFSTRQDSPFTYGGACPGKAVQDKNPAYSRDGKAVAFVSNRSGKAQVYLIAETGGEAKQLTEFPEGVKSYAFSPDGEQIVVATRSKTPGPVEADKSPTADVLVITHLRYHGNGEGFYEDKPVHLWLLTVATGEVRQLTFGPYNETDPTFAPDGKSIAFVSWRSDFEQEVTPSLYQLELATGEMTQIYEGKGMTSVPVYSPDGRSIAFFGHQQGERSGVNSAVWVVSPTGKDLKCLSEGLDRPVDNHVGTDARYETGKAAPVWSGDSRTIFFTATSEGNAEVYSVSIDGHLRCETASSFARANTSASTNATVRDSARETTSEKHVVTSFHVLDGTPLVVAEESPICPAELFLYRNGNKEQLTHHNAAFLDGHEIATPEPFNVSARDGLHVPGWILRPADFVEGRKYPLVLEIHGGPHSSYGNTFNHEFQLLAAHEYVVLYMNPRGSHGYGAEFVQGCVGDWGGGDYNDLMDAVDKAVKLPYIDADKLLVTGGSYGGYMTNWIVGHTNRFKAAVTQRCISNLHSMFGTSDIGFWFNKAELGGADLWDAEEFIMARSPIRYAKNITTPTKVIHSEEDYRCPMEQAQQWFTALKRLNVDTEFVRFAGENHDLSRNGKPLNRISRLTHILEWFEKYVR
ncbi:S9 family peptidase [Alicyclobacillus curvatus]|nr:S9 family peptidase [Alicyclobacillus curvatus]